MAYGKGCLTTHILDTAKGGPAQGVRIELYKLQGGERQLMKTVISDDDGRTDAPIIAKGSLEVGVYEFGIRDRHVFQWRGKPALGSVYRYCADPVRYRRCRPALPRAAIGISFLLFDLPGKLTRLYYHSTIR